MPVGSEVRPVDDAPAVLTGVVGRRGPSRAAKLWSAAWPKVMAAALFIGAWQVLVGTGWRSETIIPSPFTVFETFWDERGDLWGMTVNTLQRAIKGYTIALAIGVVTGIAVARSRILRAGVGSMITGLQTMPSIAWFPLSVAVFKLSEAAILFVVVLGAAPSIANGLISGVDHIPPVLLRAGRVLGARGLAAMRYVVVPAALPSFVGGLKQGWAFAWRSLLAGELIVLLGKRSLGQGLQGARDLSDYESMYAVMIMIFIVGVVVDALFFGTAERWVRRRYGLVDAAE